MRRRLFAARAALDSCRGVFQHSTIEHGGVLLVERTTGDILEFVPAPDNVKRSAIAVRIESEELELAVVSALRQRPLATVGGYAHLHVGGPAELSQGDMLELARLHGDPRFPGFGIVMLLGVRLPGRPLTLRAWIARAPYALEEMQLVEVDDPIASRAIDEAVSLMGSTAPLSSLDGMRRLELEIEGLRAKGYAARVDGAAFATRVRVTHPACKGVLYLSIPAEGFARPPKVELTTDDEAPQTLWRFPLPFFLASWSSAYTLVDLVGQVREWHCWPGRTRSQSKVSNLKGTAAP